MRICLIVRQFPAISETFVVSQAVGLLRRGHEVVLVPERVAVRDPVSDEVGRSGLMDRVIRHPAISSRWSTRAWDLATLVRGVAGSRGTIARVAVSDGRGGARAVAKTMFWAMRLQRAGHIDIVHSHFGPCVLFAVAARRAGLIQAPIVATVHGRDVTTLPRRMGEEVYRSGFGEVEAITVGSEFIAGVVAKLGAAPRKVVRLPQGVDTRIFVYRRRDWGNDQGFTVVTVARLVEVKGVDIALRAVAMASARISSLRYLIVGDGPERSRLERLAAELGILDRVVFLGAQDRASVLGAYERSDAFLLSGVNTAEGAAEGQGLAVLEAMATGLPAIVSDVGGLAESVRHNETGFLVAERDVEDLARHIVYLASQRARCRAMGEAASLNVCERFTLDSQLDRLEELYRMVLVPGRAGDRGA